MTSPIQLNPVNVKYRPPNAIGWARSLLKWRKGQTRSRMCWQIDHIIMREDLANIEGIIGDPYKLGREGGK